MQEKAKAINYFDELQEIHQDSNIPIYLKYSPLRSLLERVSKELTSTSVIQFSNLFSRISYICDQYQVSKKVQGFRITANLVLHEDYKPSQEEYLTHLMYLTEFISKTHRFAVPDTLKGFYPSHEFRKPERLSISRLDKLRVNLIEQKGDLMICHSEESEGENLIKVKAPLNFSSVSNFWKGAQLYLVNIDIDSEEVYHPRFVILEPDYLIDISSIAECFQDYGYSELHYLKSKFEEKANSKHIRLGNFANLVVDEFFSAQDMNQVTFTETFVKDFKSAPFEFTACEDLSSQGDFKAYMNDAQLHFEHIKKVITKDFADVGFSIEKASLEPSFMCELYGIQGRLDILELNKAGKSKIVELKSGSTPWPDNGKSIKTNHGVQLYLYYQLVAVLNGLSFGEVAEKTEGYILYSKVSDGNLRFDKPNLTRVQEILDLRNKIITNEHTLSLNNVSITRDLIMNLTPNNLIVADIHPNFRIKLEPQINAILEPFKTATELEKAYFFSFVSLIAKEQYLSKLGNGQYETNNGLANLWLNSFQEKADRYEVLFDLEIEENKVDSPEKEITFWRSNPDNSFVNFRDGDICVLYPRVTGSETVTTNQVFKCNIKSITKNRVIVGFRHQQRNTAFFDQFEKWAIERDFMDSSFSSMYRGIYAFLNSPKEKRDLLLTISNPQNGANYGYEAPYLSEEQNRILNKALSARDYFLLNGPPGTGKTSIIIKELVKELYTKSKSNILLLAYTNRAVDELCEAVYNGLLEVGVIAEGASEKHFVRIGNELSCSFDYRGNLLNNLIEGKAAELEGSGERFSRDSITELLASHRIYISTVASISGKTDIFKLKQFDIIIIDEASQILEPQIIGLLPLSSKFIMIGDHKQLPAIVLQDPESSKSMNLHLESIGLENRKNSLFERLYNYCEHHGLHHAFDMLTFQGRMHREIALFPSHAFYNSTLKQAYDIPNLKASIKSDLSRQVEDLKFISPTKGTLSDLLSKRRLIFFKSDSGKEEHFRKSNVKEADLVVKLVNEIMSLYCHNGKAFDAKKTIGVIAPFRNQIALIKQKLEESGIPESDQITVDTVERYQGSQRDIIIYSFAINNPFQLSGIVNLNDDGTVDRKLNVALTRAREQLILVGNDTFLSNDLIYYKLIEFVKSKGGYIKDAIHLILENRLAYQFLEEFDESLEGKIFVPDQEFSKVFETLVMDKIKFDPRTTSFPDLIFGVSNDFIRNNVIEYGRTNFDAIYKPSLFAQEFNVEDKVSLYCYYNMRKHYFTGLAIFETYKSLFQQKITLTDGRVTFIDFGCGPLTSGLAFNQSFKESHFRYALRYVGIDISNGMLIKAQEFGKSGLFPANTSFHLVNAFKKINPNLLDEWFRFSNTVVLNFSYLFANLDPEQVQELVQDINVMMENYPLNRYLLIYQNPVQSHHNFSKFKKQLRVLEKSIVRKSETVSYRNAAQSRYDKSESFTYEILSN
jgi:DNA replication ATP-dependent helicase Dna2